MSADRPPIRTATRPAMGAEVTIASDASEILIEAALAVVALLERRLSRFLPDSEVSLLNTSSGPTVVRPSTARIIEAALAGREQTDGWFDPTLGLAIAAAGYSESFDRGWGACRAAPGPVGGDVVVDGDTGLVDMATGVALDLGGIGKGWAADVAASLLFENGASFAGVEVGGDIRVRARDRTVVDVESPTPGAHEPMRIGIGDGGIAVSGPAKRRGPRGQHHLLDPRTGHPASAARVAVVVAASAAGAEMLSTAAAVAPPAAAVQFIERAGATAWLIEAGGELVSIGQPDRFLLDEGWLSEPAGRTWTT